MTQQYVSAMSHLALLSDNSRKQMVPSLVSSPFLGPMLRLMYFRAKKKFLKIKIIKIKRRFSLFVLAITVIKQQIPIACR